MKKIAIVGLLAASVFMVGCGEEKTADQIQHERQKEIMAMKMAHEREMARIEAKKIAAANPVSHTYVENEYDHRSYQQENSYGTGATQMGTSQQEAYQPTYSGTQTASSYDYQPSAPAAPQPAAQPTDEGFGVGSMALAALGGAAAGYLAGEMLNNGYKSYKDDRGNVHYTDKDGRPVSKQQYEDYKKKNPKTTAFKEKVASTSSSMKSHAAAAKADVKSTAATATAGANDMKSRAMEQKNQIKSTESYQQNKSKVEQAHGKAVSRIPPAQLPKAPTPQQNYKPASKPKPTATRPSSGGFGKKRR